MKIEVETYNETIGGELYKLYMNVSTLSHGLSDALNNGTITSDGIFKSEFKDFLDTYISNIKSNLNEINALKDGMKGEDRSNFELEYDILTENMDDLGSYVYIGSDDVTPANNTTADITPADNINANNTTGDHVINDTNQLNDNVGSNNSLALTGVPIVMLLLCTIAVFTYKKK